MKLPGYKRPKSSVCVLMVILSQKGRNLFQSILNKKKLGLIDYQHYMGGI